MEMQILDLKQCICLLIVYIKTVNFNISHLVQCILIIVYSDSMFEKENMVLVHQVLLEASEVVFKIFRTKINRGAYTIKAPATTLTAALSLIHL